MSLQSSPVLDRLENPFSDPDMDNADPRLVSELGRLFHGTARVRIWLGPAHTATDGLRFPYPETHDVTGRIGRSTGPVKCALLVHNARSRGGAAINPRRVLRIDQIETRRTLYQCDGFMFPTHVIRSVEGRYELSERKRGEEIMIATFPTFHDAYKFSEFLLGNRYSL